MLRSLPIFLVPLAALASFAILAPAPGTAAGAEEQGCVEKLLDQPRPTRTVIEVAGSRPVISVAFAYPTVAGCDYLERLPGLRFQVKRPGQPWDFLTGKNWILFRATPGTANAEGEIAKTLSGAKVDASCERGHRPRFRVEVRTQAKIVGTHRFEGTSGSALHPLSYEPAAAAHC